MESIEIKEFWSKDGSSLLRSKFEVGRVSITQYPSRLRASEIHSRLKKHLSQQGIAYRLRSEYGLALVINFFIYHC